MGLSAGWNSKCFSNASRVYALVAWPVRLSLTLELRCPASVAGMWVIHVEATTLLHGLDDPASVEIAQFGFFDPLANAGYAAMFWGGLAYRCERRRHARYMAATVLFVVAPVIWRLLRGYVPGVADLPFDYPFAAGNLGALAIALVLYRQSPKYGRPFLVTAAIIAVQAILFLTAGKLPEWAPVFASVAQADLSILLAVTGIASIAIAWHGWMTGSRRRAVPDRRTVSSPAG